MKDKLLAAVGGCTRRTRCWACGSGWADVPGLFGMQVRAVAEAAAGQIKQAGIRTVEIMVPLVGSVMELHRP